MRQGEKADTFETAMLLGEGVEALPVVMTADPAAGSPLAPDVALHAEARDHRIADSGDVARSFRDHVARCSDMMSPA